MTGAALLVAACSADDGDGAPSADRPTATSVTVPVEGLDGVGGEGLDGLVLARALVRAEDLPGFEERSFARPYRADEREGLLFCGRDLRSESGLEDGVRSVLVDGEVQVTVTVSAAADAGRAAAFVDRFGELGEACPGAWTQEASLLGVGPLEAEILGEADVGAPGPPVRAFRLRTSTEAGSSEVVAAVLAVGPVVTTVTVAGPAGAGLEEASEAVAASARQAADLVDQLG
jgi:hypothetical protein